MVTRKRSPKPELQNVVAILNQETPAEPPQNSSQIKAVPIKLVRVSANQPRQFFDEDKLTQLVQSVKEYGILEPLVVRPLKGGKYELVAGERRLRAARELRLKEVPIVVHELDDRQALQVALMENLQREDLNPVEETEAVLDLLCLSLEVERRDVMSTLYQSYNAKQRGQELNHDMRIRLEKIETILSGLGRFNATTFRSSRLPILNLPEDVLSLLREGKLEFTKGQMIARLKDEAQRQELLQQAIDEDLSFLEIKARVNELRPDLELKPEREVALRLSEIGKRVRNGNFLSDRKKRDRIKKLLDELDKLTSV